MSSNLVRRFHRLNSEGERGEEIEHDFEDKDQRLGILLRIDELEGVGSIGRFFVPFHTKTTRIKSDMFEFVGAGSLVRFSRKEYEEKMVEIDEKTFSTAELTYLDASTVYRSFEIVTDPSDRRNRRVQCNILNFQPAQIIDTYKGRHLRTIDPILGELFYNGYEFELNPDLRYEMISVERDYPTGTQSFENTKFYIKFVSTEHEVANNAENAPQEVKVDENEVIIDPSDTDTIYGIVWSYRLRSPKKSVFEFFCKELGGENNNLKLVERNSRLVEVLGDPNIPLGGLIRLSSSEYEAKWKRPGKIEGVSTANVTYLPNHALYKFKFRDDYRHLFTLEKYTISKSIENNTYNTFNHAILGLIWDNSKIIRDASYTKIQLRTAKKCWMKNYEGECGFLRFYVHAVTEVPVLTETERILRELPRKERLNNLPELLRMQNQRILEEERRRWKLVGTLKVERTCQLGGLQGATPYFTPLSRKPNPLLETIINRKSLIVYLEKPGSKCSEECPFGFVVPYNVGFCFIPVQQYRNMEFGIGDQYNFVPKSMEKNSDYYETMRQRCNGLSPNVYSVPAKSSGFDHEKLSEMYTTAVESKDPELMGKDCILDEEQEEAVRMGLNESRKLVIIHGPPGTGKTHVLAELICQSILKNKKLLIIAPSNSAVDCVSEATLKLLQERGIYRGENRMPMILTNEVVCEQMDVCGFNEDLEILKMHLEYGNTDQETYDKVEKEMFSCLTKKLLQYACVCLCTTNSKFANFVKHCGFETDTAIVDEAGAVTEEHLSSTLPSSISRIIMAGDPKELQAVVTDDSFDSADLENRKISAMERLMRANPKSNNYLELELQYRMRSEIMRLSSELFYERKLQADESVRRIFIRDLFSAPYHRNPRGFEELLMPVVFCDSAAHESNADWEKRCFDKLVFPDDGIPMPSFCNPGEALYVARYVEKLLQKNVDMGKISIITPYRAQVATIQEALRKNEKTQNKSLKVGTIGSFQGKENDIVILSLVRNNPKRNLGVLWNPNKLNVMLTRARRQLFIIGHSSTVLFNNVEKLLPLSDILKSTNAVIVRSLLKGNYYSWLNEQRDYFGADFQDYLDFNKDDIEQREFVEEFLKKKALMQEENEDEDEE